MKLTRLLFLALACAVLVPFAQAEAGWRVGFGFYAPVYVRPYPYRVVVTPPPVYVQPTYVEPAAPVYVQPAVPVYVQPGPVLVQPAPVYRYRYYW